MVCSKCGKDKLEDEFYRSRGKACKECCLVIDKKWMKRNPEKTLMYRYDYAKRHPEVVKKKAKNWYKKNRHKILANILQKKAHYLLDKAVEKGKIVRPATCSYCLAPKPEAHHPDYTQPYYVVWVCRFHHRAMEKGLLKVPQSH